MIDLGRLVGTSSDAKMIDASRRTTASLPSPDSHTRGAVPRQKTGDCELLADLEADGLLEDYRYKQLALAGTADPKPILKEALKM